jgi:hypothetical protein
MACLLEFRASPVHARIRDETPQSFRIFPISFVSVAAKEGYADVSFVSVNSA